MTTRPSITPSSLLRALATMPIRGYRRFISPMIAPRCRYAPTCSQYALDAITTHGIIKGTILATWRLLRCNPWSHGGVDHVPAKGRWTSDEWVPPADWAGNATDIVRPTPMGMTSDEARTGLVPTNVPASATDTGATGALAS